MLLFDAIVDFYLFLGGMQIFSNTQMTVERSWKCVLQVQDELTGDITRNGTM